MFRKLKTFIYLTFVRLQKWFRKKIKLINEHIDIKKVQAAYPKKVNEIKEKKIVNVCFLMLNPSTWKYDELYNNLCENPKFAVKVVIIPIVNFGDDENCQKELKISKEYCENKKYNFVLPQKNGQWVDIKKELKPDVVFFSNPNFISNPLYHINHFTDVLTAYVPYSIRIDNLNQYSYNDIFINKIWRNYFETDMHKQHSKMYSRIKGVNVKVAGHPIIDSYRVEKKEKVSVWKNNSQNKKKIIWAPHWTIKGFQESGLDWAAFLDYADFMVEMKEKYKNEVSFAFKPHPFLKIILALPNLWDKEKTNGYYDIWRNSTNSQLEEGEYIDLFIESDGLIHDSGSFAVEYLELNKPVLYTKSRNDVEDTYNELGKEALQCHYMCTSKNDIEKFIANIVEGKNDSLYDKRYEFKMKHLYNNGVSSSAFIMNDLLETFSIKND
jgi:hypothetical protein